MADKQNKPGPLNEGQTKGNTKVTTTQTTQASPPPKPPKPPKSK